MLIVAVTALLIVANGAPVLAGNLLAQSASWRIDGQLTLWDGRPLFGATKTWRGLIASLVLSALAAMLLDLGWKTGALVALGAMLGDLLSSFSKRRMGLASSARATGLDQIPEALIPACLLSQVLGYSWTILLPAAFLFVAVDICLSPLLYRLGLRRVPH